MNILRRGMPLALLLSLCVPASAEPAAYDPRLDGVRVDVRVQDAKIGKFLESLSAQARLSFVLTEDFEDKQITAFLKRVTAREALEILRETKGIGYRQVAAGTYLVAPIGSAALERPAVIDGGNGMDTRVTIRLRGATIAQFLDALSSQADVNFVLDDDVKDRKVTAFLTDVTAREALEIVLASKDLTCRRLEGQDVRRVGRSP